MKKKINGKLLILVLAIIFFGSFFLFHNPATDEFTWPPPKRIEQK